MSAFAASLPAAIPSPDTAVWWLGPVPLRAYALCIMLGIVAAVAITHYRLKARGGTGEEIFDIAVWAIVFGIIGGRLYHVVSSPWPYFGEDGNLLAALRIWEGGLGIWGAVALGAVGAWIGCRRHGHSFGDLADALAPGLLVAQALGRWGNWFNNELYGGPTDAPWAVVIHEWDAGAGRAVTDAAGEPVVLGTFQPTFLFESLWCLTLAVVLLLLDRRVPFRRGQVFALYIVGYTLGRFFIELMRTDPAQLVLGQRINVWVAAAVGLAGIVLYLVLGRRSDRPVRGPGTAPRQEVSQTAAGT
ncbi:prolipoprotein diacylglyceryl transferase [Ornithinicoccus halotolerans]|uniref:prolipoprotein diacylglyceryl transferase n=1 Tax=Ornithinicoccus halotolerans TaxID=1748220 RepID=UPI00129605C5|nr:prolipoprotein diacylglyceryl transferase [Ornithinicoccus halotolerans]